MIGFLRGIVLGFDNGILLLDVNGIGLELRVKASFSVNVGEELALYVDTIVRDDGFFLYAFETIEEKQLFKLLYSIKDIGPKMAQAIVENFGLNELRDIVLREDVKILTSIPRMGKKTAERLIFELKRKAEKLFTGISAGQGGKSNTALNNKYLDIRLALEQLGYSSMQSETMLRNFLKRSKLDIDTLDIASIIKEILRQRL